MIQTLEWTERGVQGAARFSQRLWRLVGEAAEISRDAPAPRPAQFSPAALALRKATHKALANVTDAVSNNRIVGALRATQGQIDLFRDICKARRRD